MSRNPYIELYSFIGVGLGRELSFLEIFDLARFWPYDPSLRGYDPVDKGVSDCRANMAHIAHIGLQEIWHI